MLEVNGLAEKLSSAMDVDNDEWHNSVMKMMSGKQAAAPFSAEQIKKGRSFLESWLEGEGFARTPGAKDVQQDPDLRLLQASLRRCKTLMRKRLTLTARA